MMKNQWTIGLDVAWRSFPSHVVSGIDPNGGVVDGATMGEPANTMAGEAAMGVELLLSDLHVRQGAGVSEAGVVGRPRLHESEPALDRGGFTGGVHALYETPRRYGALGECPRRVPV